jgi:hypothetical protein
MVEGDVLISPITGRALHEPGSVAAAMDTRSKRVLNTAHAPYDLASLGRALREGRHVSGRPLHAMMPRYQLSDDEVLALDAYLDTLSPTWSPGVTATKVRLASVITPDVDPATRRTAIEMMRTFVSRKNLGTRPGRRHMVSTLEFVLRSERQWEHEIWELQGPPESWAAQLRSLQAAKPVFAIASGVARDWGPVHAFCQNEQLPCWFPVTEALPAEAATADWGLYFSSGVALEAEVIARKLGGVVPDGRRVLQLVDADTVASDAGAALDQGLHGSGWHTRTVKLAELDDQQLDAWVQGLKHDDVLVLWLRPAALARLVSRAPGAASVWLGARLAGGEQTELPLAWRQRATMAYPYELPDRRAGHMVRLKSWLSQMRLPLSDEVLQSELYFALSYLNETLGDMLHNLHRSYLIERAEAMLDRREREATTSDLVAQHSLRRVTLDRLAQQGAAPLDTLPGAAAVEAGPSREDLVATRQGTTLYARLSLAPGQRLAVKGAWAVRLDAQPFGAQAEWVVP